MRYIDLDLVAEALNGGALIAASDNARVRIAAATDQDRKDAIDSERTHWVAFRGLFESLYGAKCWYTECENPGTDDDIDHFRPKGSLAEDETHGGYWWEALNWRNFRLSCHRANRLRVNPESGRTHGKGDHFPLIDESVRCRTPTDDLARESPLLLDPTAPDDPPLLSFNIDGTVALSPSAEAVPNARARVDASRVYLHLEWPRIKEGRQRVYRRVVTLVNDGDRGDERWRRGDGGGREVLRAAARDLIRLTRAREQYSRAARDYVRLFRSRDWVSRMVLPNLGGDYEDAA